MDETVVSPTPRAQPEPMKAKAAGELFEPSAKGLKYPSRGAL